MDDIRKAIFWTSAYFLGTCGIIYFNPRFDWLTIFWLSGLSILLGISYYLVNKHKKAKLLKSIDQLLELLHSTEKQETNIAIKEDAFSVLRDEIYKNISSQRRARNEAIRAKEKLRSNMEDITHQIKTPLTGILLFLDLLEADSNNSLEYQKRIRQEVERIYELSDLILKLSSLDVKAIVFEKTSFSAKGLLVDVELSLDYLISQKNISIDILGDDFILIADRTWILQALINIVKNALEVSPEGSKVCITINENAIFQSVIVKDSGPGLTMEEQKRVFERFYKSNPRSPGYGIGLAMAQSIVKQQGGELLVKSTNQGSEFELRLYPHINIEKELI
ncbi:MAG: HAMP domain-containing histidine kinase [Candidatus Methanofastidiosa archaeon]|nr:HAMP domain-containing histidine kinase [Candidatus Methanofastidiosa archaeon]